MRYENQHLTSGWGRILNADGSKSVNVFYVLYSADAYAGSSHYPVRMPDELRVKEFDFRGEDRSKKIEAPAWVKREGTTLETERGESYRISGDGAVGWCISPLRKPEESEEGGGVA